MTQVRPMQTIPQRLLLELMEEFLSSSEIGTCKPGGAAGKHPYHDLERLTSTWREVEMEKKPVLMTSPTLGFSEVTAPLHLVIFIC